MPYGLRLTKIEFIELCLCKKMKIKHITKKIYIYNLLLMLNLLKIKLDQLNNID